MHRGNRHVELMLSDEDRTTLVRWTARQKTSQALALRARIVLKSAENIANSAVASHLRVTNATVGKSRNRFIAKGVGFKNYIWPLVERIPERRMTSAR
jgi:hypothetical protein